MLARSRKANPPSIVGVNFPAPIGGINSVSPGPAMPSTDCIYAWNVVAAEQGMRARLGDTEQCTGLLDKDGAAAEVRSVLPFTGSAANGSRNRIFATTNLGIYDCTLSGIAGVVAWAPSTVYAAGDRVLNDGGKTYVCVTPGTSDLATGPTGTGAGIVDATVTWDSASAPQLVHSWTDTSGDAGYGICAVSVTAAGHFLTYFDEVNGYHVYTESTDTWVQVTAKATDLWVLSTAYLVGDKVLNDGGKTFICITAGTSAGSGGPTGTAADITDNTAHWKYIGTVVGGVNPNNLVFGMVWKNRLWVVERDTARAWYFPLFALFTEGTGINATSFNFGTRFRQGGPLVGLWSWTNDGGAGIDDKLVAVSNGGDVVVYSGTDPATAGAFSMVGVWSVGQVPAGRRIATDYGGDLLIMSRVGVMPMSRLVLGNPIIDRTQYSTYKISNLFNFIMSTTADLKGWSIQIQPEDNALILTVPVEASTSYQLVMSLATKGWTQYRELPIFSGAQYGGRLYFGTMDGRLCINTGYLAGVTLADPATYSAIQCSILGAVFNNKNARQKKVESLRPTFLCYGSEPNFQIKVRWRYDQTELPPVSWSIVPRGGNTWDSAIWDTAKWSDQPSPSQVVRGCAGMGPEFAVILSFTSVARTTYAGTDVVFREGGVF